MESFYFPVSLYKINYAQSVGSYFAIYEAWLFCIVEVVAH